MKRYKFKVGEVVRHLLMYKEGQSANLANMRLLRVLNRKYIDGFPYYKCEKISICWILNNNESVKEIVSEYDYTPEVQLKSIYPGASIVEDYIPERYLYKEDYEFYCDVPECGNSGCEIIQNLLDDDSLIKEEELKKTMDDINFYNECIDGCRNRINAYETAIWGLKQLIEEEKDRSKEYMNKIAILTNDEELYQKTFIYTIQD